MGKKPTVEGLAQAIVLIDAALEDSASERTRRSALRVAIRELGKVAESGDLWSDLYERAQSTEVDLTDAHIERVDDLLASKISGLFIQCNWKPPPKVSELIEETRLALELATKGEEAPTVRVEEARAALRHFVAKVVERLPQANPSYLPRLLKATKRAALPALLLVKFLNPEISTGNEFGYDLSVSKDGASVVMEIPVKDMVKAASGAALGVAGDLARTAQEGIDDLALEEKLEAHNPFGEHLSGQESQDVESDTSDWWMPKEVWHGKDGNGEEGKGKTSSQGL